MSYFWHTIPLSSVHDSFFFYFPFPVFRQSIQHSYMIDTYFSPKQYIFLLHLIQYFFFFLNTDQVPPKCWNRHIFPQDSKAKQTIIVCKITLFWLPHRYLRWKIREYFHYFVSGLLIFGGLSFSTITFYINVLSCHYCGQLLTRFSPYMLSYLPNLIVILILHLNYTVFVNAHQWTGSVREADIPSALQEIQRVLPS